MSGQSHASTGSGLGIVGWDAYEFVVADLERSRRFYTAQMEVPEVARLDERVAAERRRGRGSLRGRQGEGRVRDAARAGVARRALAAPAPRRRGRAGAPRARPRRRPTGRSRSAAPPSCRSPPRRPTTRGGPTGTSRSPRRSATCACASSSGPRARCRPGSAASKADGPANPFGFQVIDHVTSNFLTIEPHVDLAARRDGVRGVLAGALPHRGHPRRDGGGSGLASIVMWDPESGIKLANNEPAAPNYEASQIYTFVEANHGAGVQHVAFHVPQIVPAVDGLRRAGIDFLDTPATYYDMLPARLVSRRGLDVRRGHRRAPAPRHPRRRRRRPLPAADLHGRGRRDVRGRQRRAVLLRDHPAARRARLRRGQLPRPVRGDRARPGAPGEAERTQLDAGAGS